MSQSLWIASKARSWLVACPIALPSGGALAKSEIYCEISGTSFAWGAQYGGTVIAPDGAVALFEYDFAKSPGAREALFGEDWLAPTRQQLINRFRPGRRIVGTICADRRAWLRDQVAVVNGSIALRLFECIESRFGAPAQCQRFRSVALFEEQAALSTQLQHAFQVIQHPVRAGFVAHCAQRADVPTKQSFAALAESACNVSMAQPGTPNLNWSRTQLTRPRPSVSTLGSKVEAFGTYKSQVHILSPDHMFLHL